MFFLKSILNKNILIYLIFFLFSYFWSLKIFYEFGTDYGQYLAGSIFIDKDYKLYSDHFDNKGPAYYLFLKIIYSIFNLEYTNINYGLMTSLIFYFFPAIFFINKYFKQDQNFIKLFFFCILITTVFGQNTNASIFFFFNGLIFLSFINLYLFLKNNSFLHFTLGIIFFYLALNTIILAIFFFPVLISVLFFSFKKKQNKNNRIILLFSFFFIPLVIFQLFKVFFGISFFNFFENNLMFNFFYAIIFHDQFTSFVININREFHFIYLLSTTLIFLLFGIIYKHFTKDFFKKFKVFNLSKNTSEKNQIKVFALLIFLGGLLCEIFLNSDKSYYVLIFSNCIIFSSLILIEKNFFLKIYKFLFPILLYSFILVVGPIFSKLLFNYECMKNLYCDNNSNFKFYETVSVDLVDKKNDKIVIIGNSQGWPYIFNNKKPGGSLINSFLYRNDFFYENDAFVKLHERIKSKKFKYIIIDNYIMDQKNKNRYLLEILSFNQKILRYKFYSKIIF